MIYKSYFYNRMYWVVNHASAMPDLLSHLAVKEQTLYSDNGQSNNMVIGHQISVIYNPLL